MKRGSEFMLAVLVLSMLFLMSCGSSGSSDSSGGGDSGGDGGEGTSGGDGTGDFHITGQLAAGTYSTSAMKANAATATDVLAVNPSTGGTTCSLVSVGSTGTFDLPVAGNLLYLVTFVNSDETGEDMFQGQFVTDSTETLPVNETSGTTDLGTVTIEPETGDATSDRETSTILEEVNVDSETAEVIGGQDEIARRYSNPDVDADGQIDCLQDGHTFILDFHVRYNMTVDGSNARINNIIDSYLPVTSSTVTTYSSTGVYVSYPTAYSSAQTGSVQFVDTDVTTSEGGNAPQDTPKGTWITDVTANSFTGYYGFGVNLTSGSDLPIGTVKFLIASNELTFTRLMTPDLRDINAQDDRGFPFIKINKTTPGCTTNCTIASIDYKWVKRASSGAWSAMTLQELGALVEADSPMASWNVGSDSSSQRIEFRIPMTSLEGSITWSSANANLINVSEAQFQAFVTSDICNLGLGYDDKLGMRYFEGIQDATGTCAD